MLMASPPEDSMLPSVPNASHAGRHPQSRSPGAETRGGGVPCKEASCSRAVAYPPGVALLQRSALGFRWVLDHSSGLPRKIHRHERVLRDTALEREGHKVMRRRGRSHSGAQRHLGTKDGGATPCLSPTPQHPEEQAERSVMWGPGAATGPGLSSEEERSSPHGLKAAGAGGQGHWDPMVSLGLPGLYWQESEKWKYHGEPPGAHQTHVQEWTLKGHDDGIL